MDNFADRLITLGKEKNSRVIFEMGPVPGAMPEFYEEKYDSRGAMLFAYCVDLLRAVKDVVPAVMFNRAAFEFYGVDGIISLAMLTRYAADLQLPVIINGCFGGSGDDILKYAEGCFYGDSGSSGNRMYADAITVTPYAGSDALKKLARLCDEEGKAAFVAARPSGVDAADDIENVKTDRGELLYEVAFDDAGAFGEAYIGENGYSVLGTMTVPQPDIVGLRNINRWGIALVCAKPVDLERPETYGLFYPGEGEGEFIVLSEKDIVAECGAGNADAESVAGVLQELAEKAEEQRLAAI